MKTLIKNKIEHFRVEIRKKQNEQLFTEKRVKLSSNENSIVKNK